MHARGYKKLATNAVAATSSLWLWRPKLHYFEHLLDTIREERINMVYLWNFREEDLMGVGISVASMTHRLTAPDRTLDRYAIRLGLALQGRGEVPAGRPAWLV